MSTVSLLHFNGLDASTAFTDVSGKTWTANGNAQLDTAQFKFGTASGLFDGTGDFISTPNHADFNFGSGDFTIDFQVRLSVDANMNIVGNGFDVGWMIQYITSLSPDRMRIWLEGTNYDFNTSLNTGQWYHFAFTRSGTNLRCFEDGVQIGTTQSSSENISTTNELRIGVDVSDATYMNGWIDEMRIVKGEAKWTANFTAPTSEYLDFSASPSVTASSSISLSPSRSISLSPSASVSPSSSFSPSPSVSVSPSPVENSLCVDLVCLHFKINYASKYSIQGTGYSNKYTVHNTTYSDKYTTKIEDC